MITIFVVDDHALMRQILRSILEEKLGLHVLGVAGDGGMAAVLMVKNTQRVRHPEAPLEWGNMRAVHEIERAF